MTTALIILDGWGYSESKDDNAIYHGKTPTMDQLWQQQPHTLISGSGIDVGLPEGQMGNSEVGHMTLGAGRVICQNLTQINEAIDDGSFYHKDSYVKAIDETVRTGKSLHVLGLLSGGGVHSHEKHIFALIKMAVERGCEKVYLHAFLDGRDSPPKSAKTSLQASEKLFQDLGYGKIASVIGRYYAMDRDQRWDRISQAYELITEGKANYGAGNALEALKAGYERGETDEFISATCVGNRSVTMEDGDHVIVMNFRADRTRQICRALLLESFDGFDRRYRPNINMTTTTEYEKFDQVEVAFKAPILKNNLPEYIANLDKSQLRIAETEKYAHVTFFFSGGREESYAKEMRVLVNSPDVATYDLKPEMSAFEVTDKLVEYIESGTMDLIICNFANADMVGHTGVFSAAVKAVETIDLCITEIVQALDAVNGQCLITADHGNVEKMVNSQSGEPLTSHTSEPVPLIYYGPERIGLKNEGTLADIAPTILTLMKLPIPNEMSGKSLIIDAL